MKKPFVLLLLFLSFGLFGYAQTTSRIIKKQSFSIVEYQDQQYNDYEVNFLDGSPNEITIVISQGYTKKDVPLCLYFDLKSNDKSIPQGYFTSFYKTDDNLLKDAFVTKEYEEWGDAYHHFKTNHVELYIRKFDEQNYTVSGYVELDNDERDIIRFSYYGQIKSAYNEVKGLAVWNPLDYENNKGEIQLNDKSISTPYAFRKQRKDSYRFLITDKLLLMDPELEYGVYFDYTSYQLPVGSFKVGEPDAPIRAAFFNRYKSEYPSDSEITIKYNKKKEVYTINYILTFEDGKTIKGKYEGKIPKAD